MTPNITLAALLAGSLFCNPAFAADAVGLKTTTVSSQARAKDLAVTIWYPSTGQNGTPVMSGDNRIFEGAPALEDAEVKRGRFPLVLISHGSGSRAEGMAWIATKLASEGFIVAGTNHPGTTSGDSTPADTPKIWERTDDLSTLVTALTSNKDWANAIDADKIGVLGFSLGGSAAMEISGARADLDAYVQYCVDHASSMDCEWFSGGRAYVNGEEVNVPKFDLRTVDRVRFEQSNRDQRIRSAVLVDPGLEVVFTSESLGKIDIPLAFINLGSVGKIPISVLSDQLAKDVQNSTYAQVNEADHFSFLPVCKPGAAEFLKSVGERDPICEPAGTRDRRDIHAELETMIVSAFNRTLKPGQ